MYYFETTLSILSVFQDMFKINFNLFAIYLMYSKCVKIYPLQVHLVYFNYTPLILFIVHFNVVLEVHYKVILS